MHSERRGSAVARTTGSQPRASSCDASLGRTDTDRSEHPFQKSFPISKREVYDAYTRVKRGGRAAGVDRQSMAEFEQRVGANLYRLWNVLASGSYMPPPVRTVEIPKGLGKTRTLGIPTVSDRIAQMVVKRRLEPMVDPHFVPDSYGYRPKKSAHDALRVTRKRCWDYAWAIDLDIRNFFDTIPHDLLVQAVARHVQEREARWIILYITRWLNAPGMAKDGTITARHRGTPQGGVISPLIANLFLHYTCDRWMGKMFPQLPFERYADDAIVHCRTEREANQVREAIATRFAQCGLELHSDKTRIVYCQDSNRRGTYPHTSFDFLGYTFRPRSSRRARDGRLFVSFSPAIATTKEASIRREITQWQLSNRSSESLESIAEAINPKIRGWLGYYGRYGRSQLYPIMNQIDRALRQWIRRKYRHVEKYKRRAARMLERIRTQRPSLFAHWELPAWCVR